MLNKTIKKSCLQLKQNGEKGFQNTVLVTALRFRLEKWFLFDL